MVHCCKNYEMQTLVLHFGIFWVIAGITGVFVGTFKDLSGSGSPISRTHIAGSLWGWVVFMVTLWYDCIPRNPYQSL
jgi:hypothetical protein